MDMRHIENSKMAGINLVTSIIKCRQTKKSKLKGRHCQTSYKCKMKHAIYKRDTLDSKTIRGWKKIYHDANSNHKERWTCHTDIR